jgi:hypothetical protein
MQVPARETVARGVPAGRLTPDEMRAFKAIGRTVRRLAKEKRQHGDAAPKASAPPAPKPVRVAGNGQAAEALLLSAFDLVLHLSGDLAIERVEGRPQIAGWRKSRMVGQPAGKVLPPQELTILHRMVKKLRAGARNSRDTLVLSGENRECVPCRAVLGRFAEGDAGYFLALLSLELPARLKRQPGLAPITRLAA